MFKISTAITAMTSIAVAAAIAFFAVLPDAVQARTPQPVTKGDRLDIHPLGAACSQRAWPYYEDACLRDRNQPRSQGGGAEQGVAARDQQAGPGLLTRQQSQPEQPAERARSHRDRVAEEPCPLELPKANRFTCGHRLG